MEALGCGHILCSSCLNHLDCSSGMITCPFCKEQSGRSSIRRLYLNYVEPSRTIMSSLYYSIESQGVDTVLFQNEE